MANERDNELDIYYELKRRRERVLAQREQQRPEWDPAPARKKRVRKAESAPKDDPRVKKVVMGEEVFTAKRPVQPQQEAEPEIQEEPVRPVQPKKRPLVREEIRIPKEEERPQEQPEAPAEEEVLEEAAEVADIPETDAYDDYDADYAEDFEGDEPYDGSMDEDLVDENIGNNPFTPFVKLAGNLAGKYGEWKQIRDAQSEGAAPKKRGLKGLFGKKKQEVPLQDEEFAAEEYAYEEFPAEEPEAFGTVEAQEAPVADAIEEAPAAEEPAADVIDIGEEAAEAVEMAAEAEAADLIEMPEAEAELPDAYAEDAYEDIAYEEAPAKKKFSLKALFSRKKAVPVEEYELPDEDFGDEADYGEEEVFAETPVDGELTDELVSEEPAEELIGDVVADEAVDFPAETVDFAEEAAADEEADADEEAFEFDERYDADDEVPMKKRFSLKALFGRKKESVLDLLDEMDDFDDLDDLDDDIDEAEDLEELQEQLEDSIDEDEEESFAEDMPAEDESYEIMDEEAPIALTFAEPEEMPAEEIAEAAEEPVQEMEMIDIGEEAEAEIADADASEDEDLTDDEWDDDEDEDEYEDEEAPVKRGLFGFLRRGPKKSKADELLELLDDDDDDDEDDEDWNEFLDSADEERSIEDMNEKNLIANQMADGIEERGLSRKERRELAERMAAEASAQEAAVETVEEEIAVAEEEVDEPTRSFKPVRTTRETPAAEDDYDDFDDEDEEEEAPAPKKKGMFSRKAKKASMKDDELDDLLFGDEKPASKKPAKSKYDDEDDYDDYDDYDDDDDEDFDDFDDDDDEDEGRGFFSRLIGVVFTIIIILVAAVLVLNLLAGRGFAPAQTAVNAIGNVLPASVSEKIFPEYEPEVEIEMQPSAVEGNDAVVEGDPFAITDPVTEGDAAEPITTPAPAN